MRAILFVAGLLATGGCDSVFGLDSLEDPTDLDPRDAVEDGGTPDAPGCANGTATLAAALDTYLDSPTAHGTREVLVLDANATVIVMFPAGEAVETATLRLVHPTMARGCATGGAACEACPAGTAGSVTVQWMRADWNEHATSTERDDSGRQWTGENASGSGDRGTTIATVTYTPGTDLEITLTRAPTDQRPEWAGGEANVALQLRTTGAFAIFAAREGATDACMPVIPPVLSTGCTR